MKGEPTPPGDIKSVEQVRIDALEESVRTLTNRLETYLLLSRAFTEAVRIDLGTKMAIIANMTLCLGGSDAREKFAIDMAKRFEGLTPIDVLAKQIFTKNLQERSEGKEEFHDSEHGEK